MLSLYVKVDIYKHSTDFQTLYNGISKLREISVKITRRKLRSALTQAKIESGTSEKHVRKLQ